MYVITAKTKDGTKVFLSKTIFTDEVYFSFYAKYASLFSSVESTSSIEIPEYLKKFYADIQTEEVKNNFVEN